MLKDLNRLGIDAINRRNQYLNTEIKLPENFKALFKQKFPSAKMKFQEYTSIDFTPKGLSIIIPNQWFLIASFFTEFLNSLFAYKKYAEELDFTAEDIKKIRESKSIDQLSYRERIDGRFTDESDKRFFIKFLTDYDWWFGSKTIDRGDFFVSAILNLASVVHVTQGYIATLTELLCKNGDLASLLHDLSRQLNYKNDIIDVRKSFAEWLVKNTNSNYFNNDLDKTIKGLQQYQQLYEEEFETPLFEVTLEYLDEKIAEISRNIWNNESKFWQYSEKKSTHQPRAILGDENYLKFLKTLDNVELKRGYNKIFFGAPGTGKSHCISTLLEDENVKEEQVERVTFHPDFDYNAFVGGYKPVSEENDQNEEVIRYKFVPQVFVNIYLKAHQNPNRNYYLIIEEINRGNCAEIFGDIFQLLDRDTGYKISSSEDLRKYLKEADKKAKHKSLNNGKLSMPNNLIILATMNTSDQSLFPMDSAFKRRWDWQYVPIKYPKDENDSSCPSFDFQIRVDDETYVTWIELIKSINAHIVQNPSLGMDKCLGNFFIKPSQGITINFEDFVHKVMFYLWNDVFKDEENEIFQEQTYLDYFPVETNGVANFKKLAGKLAVHLRAVNSVQEMEENTQQSSLF